MVSEPESFPIILYSLVNISAKATPLFTVMSTESATSGNSNITTKTLFVTSLSGGDISSLQISTHHLNGRNYLQWAQSVKIVICTRGKLEFITGDLSDLAKADPSYNRGWPTIPLFSHGWWTQCNLPSAAPTCGSQRQKKSGMLLERCTMILGMHLRCSTFGQNWKGLKQIGKTQWNVNGYLL